MKTNKYQIEFIDLIIARFKTFSYCINNINVYDSELAVTNMNEFEITVSEFFKEGYDVQHKIPTYLISLNLETFCTHLLELKEIKE